VDEWSNRAVWQIAGGSMGRNYADDFVAHDLIAVGGDPAEAAVEAFGRMRDGDLVVLRDGGSRTEVRAIGVLLGAPPEDFGPYFVAQGWPLEYIRRVRWVVEDVGRIDGLVLPRVRVSRIGAKGRPLVAARIVASAVGVDRPLRELPTTAVPVGIDGLSLPEPLQSLRLLATRFQSLRFESQQEFGPLPRENEATSHFVVPMLVALGWPYHLVAVEWHRVDVAAFICLPRVPENCHLIVEVKHVGIGPRGADSQSAGYKEDRRLPAATARFASDGIRFWAFQEGGTTLELDLLRPTLDGLAVIDLLRPPTSILRP
jgi:hypothetical protein